MGVSKVTLIFGLVFFAGLVRLGKSAREIECYECKDCEKEDLGEQTCMGKFCYIIQKVKYERGCTDNAGFCGPHAGMNHDCEVCMPGKCNNRYSSASGMTSSFVLPSLAFAIFRLI